jgi:hypothetical protein
MPSASLLLAASSSSKRKQQEPAGSDDDTNIIFLYLHSIRASGILFAAIRPQRLKNVNFLLRSSMSMFEYNNFRMKEAPSDKNPSSNKKTLTNQVNRLEMLFFFFLNYFLNVMQLIRRFY